MSQLKGIAQTATGVALVNEINDRLRRLSLLAAGGAGTPGTPGATGAPGAPGSGSGVLDAAFTIAVTVGAAKPDLSKSAIQHVVLAASTNLVVPANRPVSKSMLWLLYIDNPSATPWAMIPDASYLTGGALVVAAGKRTVLTCSTTQSGYTQITNTLENQPIGPI